MMLESIPVPFVAVPNGAICVSEVAVHASDVAAEGGEPRTHEQRGTGADHLVYHPQVVGIDRAQIRRLLQKSKRMVSWIAACRQGCSAQTM